MVEKSQRLDLEAKFDETSDEPENTKHFTCWDAVDGDTCQWGYFHRG